jgi:uncharacterized protein (DUF1330 family)
MAAYLMSDMTIRDRTAFEAYRTRAANAIQRYGGDILGVWERCRHSKDQGIPA